MNRREMKPIEFKEQNILYTKPADMTDEECGSLPAYKDGMNNISCWTMSIKERLKVLFTGVIWINVLGKGQPPIWLGVNTPFVSNDD